MSIEVDKKVGGNCFDYLNDAIQQGLTAIISSGEKRKIAGINAGCSFVGFLICEATKQDNSSQNSCSCS